MEEWMTFVSDVGFPIIVTLYLLHRIESKLDILITSIEKIPEQMKGAQM